MSSKLKILHIANKPPFPPMDGGAIGVNNVTQGLLDCGHNVKLISVNTHKHFVDIKSLPADYRKRTNIEFGFIDTQLRFGKAFLNLFGSRSYHVERFFDSSFASLLQETLEKQQFDIIIVESVFLKDYLPVLRKNATAKIILRAPNIEYLIWKRLADEERNPLKKWYLRLLANRLEREELTAVNSFDAFFTVTEKDRHFLQSFSGEKPSACIPTGLDITKEHRLPQVEIRPKAKPTVFHLGALDWMPNQEGLEWFLKEIWPQFQDSKFYIAGRRPTREIFRWQSENVIVEGEVDDAAAFLLEHDIMVVPLFSGSGMRVKIIEGMMLGKAIVSTTIGAEGLVVSPGEDILIADDAQGFITHIRNLLNDNALLTSIASAAKENAAKNYSNINIAKNLERFLFEVLER
ncbi:MAG: glycosyltransferase [Bacteroidales bacterium]|nr:glycosyltransferase [Bacteroidales bacterium]